MDFIDAEIFASSSEWVKSNLPSGDFTNLIAEGIIPGLGEDCNLYTANCFLISIYIHIRRNGVYE